MAALTLAYYGIKRVFRRKWMSLSLSLLPIIGALIRLVFPKSAPGMIMPWACPLSCAVLLGLLFYALYEKDRVSGLMTGLKSLPLPDSAIIAANSMAGAIVFTAQMVVFEGINTLLA